MGCASSSAGGGYVVDSAKDKASAELDAQLEQQQAEENAIVKLLVLGTGESGKSTVFKQMKILYSVPDPPAKFVMICRANLFGNAHAVMSGMTVLNIAYASDKGREAAKILENDGVSQAQIGRVQRHTSGVRALQFNPHTDNAHLLASGGSDHEVFIMALERPDAPTIFSPGDAKAAKHTAEVTCVSWNSQVSHILASGDQSGNTIIWDIKSHTRVMVFFESTMFKSVLYHPDESQVLTTGSDRKITYWDCFDGQAIRMLDGSATGEINTLAILAEGEHYVSGGEDKEVKIWDYDEGIQYYKGVGHSGAITKVSFRY